GSTDNVSVTGEVAITCLKKAISYFHDHSDYLKNIAAMIFPLLLVMPQTQGLNLKALVLVNKINWPVYQNIAVSSSDEATSIPGSLSSINLKVINSLAGNFMAHPEDNISWFVESCNDSELSKTLFFFVLLQSLLLIKPKGDEFSALFGSVFPILKAEWESLVNAGDVLLDEFNSEVLDWDCSAFFDQLLYANLRSLNAKVMVCIFWKLIMSADSSGNLLDDSKIKDLFVFFASSKFKHVFSKHLHFLAAHCSVSPARLLSKFFTDEGVPAAVQVESLQCYAFLCRMSQDRWQTELLVEFPSLLVPLAGDNQSVRVASMNCTDELRALWRRIDCSGKINGNNATWFDFLGELLLLLDQQKTLILSDKKFLPSLFASTLGSSCHNILVPQNMENRFDQPTKERIIEFILGSALEFSNYGKLMILSLLKGIGNAIMHPKVAPMLSRFMKQYYDRSRKSSQKFSNTETRIMCLLLEVESCAMSSSSGGDDLQYPLLKALQLDGMTSDDPAYIEPCISVLNKLNSQFYTGLPNEVQVLLAIQLFISRVCCHS
ncbi:U3 small nucleolar RNA-associated protein, partial [Trifolium pratense]